jgi:SRSO17 transposase
MFAWGGLSSQFCQGWLDVMWSFLLSRKYMRTESESSMSLSSSSYSSPEELWNTAFNRIPGRIRQHFVRQESSLRAFAYIRGLMSEAARKNGWQIAEEVGEATPYGMQHLLDRAKWDCDGVRDALRTYVWETLADPNAVLVIDETGFLKKGGKSVGVQRQYSGTAGRIENCQIGVFLSYVSARRHTLLDRELYLPKSWTNDSQRCREAHVPASVTDAPKPELAQRMLERTLDAGLPVSWVVGDTVYGSARSLRTALEARKQAYALAVARHQNTWRCRERASEWKRLAHGIAREDWQKLSAGAGSLRTSPLHMGTH